MSTLIDNLANTAWTSFGGPLVWGGAALFGGSKKEDAISQAIKQDAAITAPINQNLNADLRPNQYDYSNNSVNVDGNNNTLGYESKKAMTASAESAQTPTATSTPSISQEATQKADASSGTDLTTITIIAVAGLVAYGLVSKPSTKRNASITRKGVHYHGK